MRRQIFVVLSLLACGVASAQQDFSAVQITTQQAGDGVYMLQGAGGNIAVCVGDDGVFIVDDQYGPLTEKIKAAIAELSDQPVSFVLNTHWHGDHTGGNEAFGETGSVIVAHDNVHTRMANEHVSTFFGGRTIPPSPDAALPRITFTERVTLQMNGGVHAIHAPHAHTDGDAMIYFQGSNVLHMGDLFFNQMYPFIDLESGGSINGVIAALNRGLMLADADTAIIPGHGPLSDRAGLQAYRDMLVTIRDRVKAHKDEGKSLEDVIEAQPGREWDEALGGGFIKPGALITFMYRSLP